MLLKQFTIPLHAKVKKNNPRNQFVLLCLGCFKSLDTGNKTLAELVSVISTHIVEHYFSFHGTHGNSPKTLGLFLHCNILQYRGRRIFSNFYPFLWNCFPCHSRTLAMLQDSSSQSNIVSCQNRFSSLACMTVYIQYLLHINLYAFLFVLFPWFLKTLFFCSVLTSCFHCRICPSASLQ